MERGKNSFPLLPCMPPSVIDLSLPVSLYLSTSLSFSVVFYFVLPLSFVCVFLSLLSSYQFRRMKLFLVSDLLKTHFVFPQSPQAPILSLSSPSSSSSSSSSPRRPPSSPRLLLFFLTSFFFCSYFASSFNFLPCFPIPVYSIFSYVCMHLYSNSYVINVIFCHTNGNLISRCYKNRGEIIIYLNSTKLSPCDKNAIFQ